ncbi:MAG: ABC transporter ATP-binding protein [Thermoproteota archaeon]|nr:ABC transporter ATP-binding protein [Candidatus Brockarchaeota archaeon]
MEKQLLAVEGLTVEYWARRGRVRAVDSVSFTLDRAETLGVVGESGSGKSTLGLSLIRLIPPPGRIIGGHLWLEGTDLLKLREEEMRNVRGRKIAFVFQDPMTSLNPVKKIGEHFVELIRTHEPKTGREEALRRAEKLLNDVGIQSERINDYPHQLSGGMRQRVMIALSIALNPSIVIADEPTTALDVIVQAKILDLLKNVQNVYAMALILITHDLSIALERCNKILVMYAGQMVEYASVENIYNKPQHPYTRGLLKSIPNIELAEQKLEAIPGSPPDLLNPPRGCRFWPRCPSSIGKCREREPQPVETEPGHFVRCFLHEVAGNESN